MPAADVDDWFVAEVLPLEGLLMGFLRRHARDADDAADLRQEVYVRVYEAARSAQPVLAKAFVFAAARNLLIDRARRDKVVSIETVADLDLLDRLADERTPERHAAARGELRLLQRALDALPLRCREVVELRKVNGLSQREVARHMGITEDTVERQISKGMRALADSLSPHGIGRVTATPARLADARRQES